MAIAKRRIGRKAPLDHLMISSKDFTDAALELDVDELLSSAKYIRNIGRTAAKYAGINLQREGEQTSEQIVFAAYETMYDLTRPSLLADGVDATKELFQKDVTQSTILSLSRAMPSYAMSRVTHKYRTQGSYLKVTENGLEVDQTFELAKASEEKGMVNRGGCPYATDNPRYFNKFTKQIVDTYIAAHSQKMPHGWLEATGRILDLRK